MRTLTALPFVALTALFAGCALQMMTPEYRGLQTDAASPHIELHILTTPPRGAAVLEDPADLEVTAAPLVSRPAMESKPTLAVTTTEIVFKSTVEPTTAPAPARDSSQTAWMTDVRAQLIALHNQARTEAGLPAFTQSPSLQRAAQLQAEFLASKPAYELIRLGPDGHVGPNSEVVGERAAHAGYIGRRISENWAYMTNVQDAFDYWVTDQWHRPQVTSGDLDEVGFGICQHPELGVVFVAVYGWP